MRRGFPHTEVPEGWAAKTVAGVGGVAGWGGKKPRNMKHPVLIGFLRGGGNWGTLRIPRED